MPPELSASSVSIERGGDKSQMPSQKKKESCPSKSNSSLIHCSILHALLPPKKGRDLLGHIRVGWSGKLYWKRKREVG